MSHDALAMIEYGNDPAVLVLADSDEGAEQARQAVVDAGCRVQAIVEIERGSRRLAEQVAVDVVHVELRKDHGAVLDRLLDQLDLAERSKRHRSIVSGPLALVDTIAARTLRPGIAHLVDASPEERAMAVLQATRRSPALLHDVGKGGVPIRLQQLSEEVGRIANALATLSESEKTDRRERVEAPVTSQQVRAILRARRLREQYFGAELFADPAWDMLLDLLAARLDQQRVAVSSLCIAAAVPATTALRWIKTLTEQGMFVRAADPQDGRRVYIELSEAAANALIAYLRAAQRISPLMS